MQIFEINRTEDLSAPAKILLENHTKRTVVLKGDLGAGKTTFVRTFVNMIDPDIIVSSPTFTLMNVYETEKLTINHFDLYRLSSAEEALEWGFDEFVLDADYSFVEWAERAPELIPVPHTLIQIKHGDSMNHRVLSIEEIEN